MFRRLVIFRSSGKRGKGKMSAVLDSLDETSLLPACAYGGIRSRKSLILHDHLSRRIFEPSFLKHTQAKAAVLLHSVLIKQTQPFAVQVEPTIFLKTSASISSVSPQKFSVSRNFLTVYKLLPSLEHVHQEIFT